MLTLTLRLSLSVGRPLENRQFDMDLLPPATKLGQGYIFTGVCDSVHRGVLPLGGRGTLPPGGCLVETPHPGRLLLRAVRILLECILVFSSVYPQLCLFVQVWTTAFHYQKIQTHFIKCTNYRPQRSWGKVIFSEACVKNSVHQGADNDPPADTPRPDTPWSRYPLSDIPRIYFGFKLQTRN